MQYLTCDDQPSVQSYLLFIDDVETTESPAQDGHAWIDITGIPSGVHELKLKAKNDWGLSDFSAPLSVEKVLPGIPSGLGLEVG